MSPVFPLNPGALSDLGLKTIQELEVGNGILASGREEIYGCIFGRDSLLTSLALLQAYERKPDIYLLSLVKKVLVHLSDLQGTEYVLESGEAPGKCIHEFRPENHEHLTCHPEKPWYVYPDNSMRNYDSVDATPLLLITFYRYLEMTGDTDFIQTHEENIESALEWLLTSSDTNGDGFTDYLFHPDRKGGGLVTQNWMDSAESVFYERSLEKVVYPIAPVEVQAYAYQALMMWADYFFSVEKPLLALRLADRAAILRGLFREKFVVRDQGETSLACSLDGNGRPLLSARSSMGHVLWASFISSRTGQRECILDEALVPTIVKRLIASDLFEPAAGIRTLSTRSRCYEARSYHNGSIWPHDTSLIIEGFENFGYSEEAALVRKAVLRAWHYFETPLELFAFDNGYHAYCGPTGQHACQKQAWSAASMLTQSLAYSP